MRAAIAARLVRAAGMHSSAAQEVLGTTCRALLRRLVAPETSKALALPIPRSDNNARAAVVEATRRFSDRWLRRPPWLRLFNRRCVFVHKIEMAVVRYLAICEPSKRVFLILRVYRRKYHGCEREVTGPNIPRVLIRGLSVQRKEGVCGI